MEITEILDQEIISLGKFALTFGDVIMALIIVLLTRMAEWVVNGMVLKRYFRRKEVDQGRSFAITQIVKYLIYFIGIILLIQALAGSVSFIALGSAGLFVGLGLGLQQTFTDFISGIILLVDRSAEVGDIIVIDESVGQVKKIGLRTSEIYTRDRVTVIVPNSKLISNNFTNWSHNSEPARFNVDVCVAYSSDIKLVEEVLLNCVTKQKEILPSPEPTVQLINFGESSLDFKVFYFSMEFFFAEKVKSNLRKEIFHQLTAAKIAIPFPQRDLWIKQVNLPAAEDE